MILSRLKPAISSNNNSAKGSARAGVSAPKSNLLQFEEYLAKRDYTGAITLLEFRQSHDYNVTYDSWIAYCAFHKGDYKRAMSIYEAFYSQNPDSKNVAINLACCYFYLGMYNESKQVLKKAPNCSLKTRLNFHLAHNLGDEESLMEHHQLLQDVLEDQLSLAAIHYLRAHYQEAIDIYKRLLLQNRENLALNVYVALCYYKLDYYDVSQEVLALYLNQYSDSVIATNLKACNHFRLYNGSAAESELRSIVEQSANAGFGNDLVRHNLVVFRNGEGAMQVLPGLVDVVTEARLNLVINYLKQDDTKEAYNLLKNLQPAVPQEYILKAVVNAALGQELNSAEHIKIAEECFQLVGSSASECDTIPGRQCMAAAFFLAGQFEEVLVYLTSIKSYLHSDDTFNFNYAQAKAACEQFKEAEETFLLIKDPKILNDYVYISNLARCYIMNKNVEQAWELYLKMDASSESFNLLLMIANECYRMGDFWYAAKAFDMLDRLEPNPEFWEGKRGAVCGVFQGVIAKRFPTELLSDVLQLLRNSTSNQADQISKIIRKYAKENRILSKMADAANKSSSKTASKSKGKLENRLRKPLASVSSDRLVKVQTPKKPKAPPKTSLASPPPKKKQKKEMADNKNAQEENSQVKLSSNHQVEPITHDDWIQLERSEEIQVISKKNVYNTDLVFTLFDEIALEGLDGVTIETLRYRLADALNVKVNLPENLENILWKQLCHVKNINFFLLPRPRKNSNRINQIIKLKAEPKAEQVAEDPYPYELFNDKDNNILGSCSTYNERLNITPEILQKNTLKQVEESYGNSVVIVASQDLRNNSLIPSLSNPLMNIMENQYGLLERIGRSRHTGEITSGPHSLLVTCKDSSTLFYLQKPMHKNNILTKQLFSYNNHNGVKSSVNIFHLQRFHRDIKSKKQLLIEHILKLLKSKPNFRLEYVELRKLFTPAIWEKLCITKLLKSQEFRQFVKTDLQLLYRELYPDASEKEWKRKANEQEKRIRVLELINPEININSMWKDDDNKDFSSDEESCSALNPNQTIRTQVYDLILSRGKDGIFPKEIEALTGLDFYSVRTITKYFQKNNLVTVTMIDAGRQRCSKLFAKEVLEKNKPIPTEIIYGDETIRFISQALKVSSSCLKCKNRENEADTVVENTVSGDNYKIVNFRENRAKEADDKIKKTQVRCIFSNKGNFVKHVISVGSNLIIPNTTVADIKLNDVFKKVVSDVQRVKKHRKPSTLFDEKVSSNESNIDSKLETNLNQMSVKGNVSAIKNLKFIDPLAKLWNREPNVLAKSYKKYQLRMLKIVDQVNKDANVKQEFPPPTEFLSSSDDESTDCNSLDENLDDNESSKVRLLDESIEEIKKNFIDKFESCEKMSGLEKQNGDVNCKKRKLLETTDQHSDERSEKRIKLENWPGKEGDHEEGADEEMEEGRVRLDMVEVLINTHSDVGMEMFMGSKPILLSENIDDDNIYTRVFSSSDTRDYSPAKMILMTERVNMRINFIKNVVFQNKVITDFAKVHQMLIKEEQSEGNKTTIDRKSLHRIYTKLAREGTLKIIKVVCKFENIIRMKNILIIPNIDLSSFLDSTIEQFKMSFFIYAKRKFDKHQQPAAEAEAASSEPATISSEIRVENVENKSDNADLDLNLTKVQFKYSRTIGRKYGYYPKFAKMRVLHEFLYYLVYEYSGKVIPDEDSSEIYANFAKTHKLDPDFIQERSPLYQREISWKMFVSPLPEHKDWPRGWTIVGDVLLRLPLSILVKIFNVTYIIPELSDKFLNHPIKKHILIKNLPPDIKDAVLSYRKYIFSIHEIFCYLCYLGLAQFGPQIFCEKDQLFVFLNRKAIIYDTTASAPGYHQIEKKEYPRLEYNLESTQELENYWNDLYMISMKTQLGQRQCVIGKYISLEGVHGKADMMATLRAQTHESATEKDVGYLPGDRLGACGADSALWLHIKRNWVYVKSQLKQSTCSLQRLTGVRKKYIDEVKPIKLSDLRNLKKQATNKKRPGNSNEIQANNRTALARKIIKSKKKINSVRPHSRKAVLRKVQPRANNFPKRVRVDVVDKNIIDRMGKTRAIFCEEEDNLLLLCKACMDYLCPSSKKRQVVFTTVRDFVHRTLPYSRKTSTAYKRRIIWLKKSNELQDKKQPLKFNLVSDYFIEKHFKRIRERFASDQVVSEIEVSLSFLYLAYYAYQKYKAAANSDLEKKEDDIDDIQDFLVDSTLEKFKIYDGEECTYASPRSEDDITTDTIKSVIHSSLGNQNNQHDWPFQLLKVYQNFPESLLRNALNSMRDQQLISGKKAYNKCANKEGSILMCGTSYHLSFAYIFKQITKYPPSIFTECHDFFLALYKHFDVFMESGCSVENMEQAHGMSVNEIATLRNLSYNFDLPDDIITLDPNLHDYTDLIKELTLRYKAIMAKMRENPDDSLRDLEFWKRIESILHNFIKTHGKGKRDGIANEEVKFENALLNRDAHPQKALKISDLAFLLTKGLFPELDDEDRLEKLNKHFLVQYPSCKVYLSDDRIYENDPMYKKCHQQVIERGHKLMEKMHRESILNNGMLEDETINNAIVTLGGNEHDKKKAFDLLTFIDNKNVYGATGEELTNTFDNPLGKLDVLTILKCLIHIGVVLRVGITSFLFVHFNHRTDWSIQLYSPTSNSNGYRVRLSPWIRIDGGVCFNILTNWFGIILSHCLSCPFITLNTLSKRFCYLKPVDIFFLLEFLQDLTCIKLKTYEETNTDLFMSFETEIREEKSTTITDNFDKIFVETDNLATIKFGAFVNRDKSNCTYAFISA